MLEMSARANRLAPVILAGALALGVWRCGMIVAGGDQPCAVLEDDSCEPGSSARQANQGAVVSGNPQIEQVLHRFRAAAGALREGALRTLFAEGAEDRPSGAYRSPYWIRARYPAAFQTLQRNMAIPEYGPAGRPIVCTIAGRQAWGYGNSGTVAPYIDPGRSEPIDPRMVVARREVLRIMLGVVPDLLFQSSIVSASSTETVTAKTERLVGLAVSDDAGPFGTLVFSEQTGLPVSLTFRYVTPIPTRQTLEMVMRYGDFRRVSGRLFPHSIDRESHGQVSLRLRMNRYVVNGGLSDDVFAPATKQTIDRIVPPAPTKAPEHQGRLVRRERPSAPPSAR